jgi:hypothetical protein
MVWKLTKDKRQRVEPKESVVSLFSLWNYRNWKAGNSILLFYVGLLRPGRSKQKSRRLPGRPSQYFLINIAQLTTTTTKATETTLSLVSQNSGALAVDVLTLTQSPGPGLEYKTESAR